MNYVIATSRKDRKAYLTFRKGKDRNTAVPKSLQPASIDVSMLEAVKMKPLVSVGTRIIPNSNG